MKLPRLLRCACLSLMALQFVSESRAADGLSLDDLIALLQAGSKTEEILPELNKRGYEGATDNAALKQLKQAGADVALLLAVRNFSEASSSAGGTPGKAGTTADTKAPWGKTISLKLSDELSLKMCWVAQLDMYVGQYEVSSKEFMAYGPYSQKDKRTAADGDQAWKSSEVDDQRISRMEKRTLPAAVSWKEAGRFCENLTSDLGGQNPQLEGIGRWRVRLPWLREWKVCVGDAKWEDAVSEGTIKGFPEYTRRLDLPAFDPLPSGSSKVNSLGLYDVLGNMAEWCLDPWSFENSEPKKQRALAGGSFLGDTPDDSGYDPERYQPNSGFRCVLEAAPKETTEAAPSSTDAKPVDDLPYATPVPGRPGFVTSPYAKKNQLIDVSGLPAGLEFKCPYSGKIFRVPPQ